MAVMATSFKRTYASCCTSRTVVLSPSSCGRPLLTHSSIRDSRIHRGKSGSVSCVVTAPFSWVLLCARFYLCPPRVSVSPILWKFYNQILLTFKVRLPGDTQSLWQIPRLDDQGQRRSCNKMVGGSQSHLKSNVVPARDT